METNVRLVVAIGVIGLSVLAGVETGRENLGGFGLVTSTLLAGVGWFARDLHREALERRSVLQAYAAVIASQYRFMRDVLHDRQLDLWLTRAPDIAAGRQAQSIGRTPENPYPILPDIRQFLHIFPPEAIDLLCRWHYRDVDMVDIWAELGTRQLSRIGPERLATYFAQVREYRDEYRDTAYTCLLVLSHEYPRLEPDLHLFREDHARDLRTARSGER